MAASLSFRAAVAPTSAMFASRTTVRAAKPVAAVSLFGKKTAAAPKKAAVKSMVSKPKPKPVAKKVVAKKVVAKPAAKKSAFSFGGSTAKKPSAFSFGGSPSSTKPKPAAKKPLAPKKAGTGNYTITKTAGTVRKSKPTTFKTVNVNKKPAAVISTRPTPMKTVKPAVYDKATIGTVGVASIFAGTFLLTLAALPAATESALEVIGIGYSAYFTYNWFFNPESRGELDKTLTMIDNETGINLKKVASVTGAAVSDASKKLAASAEKSAEASAAAKADAARSAKTAAAAAVDKADAPAAEEAKKTFKEAVKEAVKDADK